MPSVAISGDARGRYEKRVDRLRNRRRINIPVVTRDAHTGMRSFVYDTTIPYQSWMATAALYVESEETTWQGRHPHSYEDLLLSSLPSGGKSGGIGVASHAPVAPAATSSSVNGVGAAKGGTASASSVRVTRPVAISLKASWVQFLAPAPSADNNTLIDGEFQLPYNRRLKAGEYRLIADSIQAAIDREVGRYATRLLGVELNGYGAPINDYQKSERWASEQTMRLRQILIDRGITGENDLRVTWVAEDWEGIRRLVGESPMPLRMATEDIIRTIGVTQGREQALRNLGSGSAYHYLRREVFPEVCRLSFVLRFTPRSVGITADSRLNQGKPQGITADNFYTLASTYEAGSREFCDIIDLAARLFPNCVEASVDGAGVALLHGDLKKARRYLKPWESDPRAWCNLGLLYYMEGSPDKAEVYLRMASSRGVEQASRALERYKLGR